MSDGKVADGGTLLMAPVVPLPSRPVASTRRGSMEAQKRVGLSCSRRGTATT